MRLGSAKPMSSSAVKKQELAARLANRNNQTPIQAQEEPLRKSLLIAAVACSLLLPMLASAHSERETPSPARPGAVPDGSRTPTAVLDVCKRQADTCYRHIQAAVNAAPEGALIQIWPGLYKEEPSRAAAEEPMLPGETDFSYLYHQTFPNSQNLIAVIGKKNLTLRGMGSSARDVVIDVGFEKHVGIRGDRADGLIVENLSVWHAYDHGIYILDQDGFIVDNVVAGWNRDYGFLTFAVDHGVIRNCEAFGAGDAGIYPGGTANTPGRYSVEVANCKSYHNVLGYSGTQGNYVWIHDNEFYDNAVGMTSDSETDHPNYPQESLKLENSKFYNNNFNVYSPSSDVRVTVAVEGIFLPVGTGVFLASGNSNLVQNNYFWDHARYGFWLASGQGIVIGPTSNPPADPFMSSNNRVLNNKFYPAAGYPGTKHAPLITDLNALAQTRLRWNGADIGWDGLGTANCFQANASSAAGDAVLTDGVALPPCDPAAAPAWTPNAFNLAAQAGLVYVEGFPVRCLMTMCGDISGPAPGNAHNIPASEGGSGIAQWVAPPTCGPTGCG